jgi:cell division protein FtsZ
MSKDIYDNIDKGSGFESGSKIEKAPTIIKVLGVGGGGSNAVNHMYDQNIDGVSFVVINTDRQALNSSPVPNRLLIGPKTTQGLGAGNDPEVAKSAAEESTKDIEDLFDNDTKMVFITAGMGGGTGTGAAPVVAKIAKDKGVLTIGIVTIPFLFEGQKKILKAIDGANEMQKYVDALLVINNERLTDIYPDLNFINAFGKADDTLSTAARSISELITAQGHINLDFKDVNTTLRNGGVAIISSGYGEGEKRVTQAIENALNSPLLKNRDIYGSSKILINFYFSREAKAPFKMSEINEMKDFMTNFSTDVDVIWGVAYDDSLGDKIKITILAAGFNVSLNNDAPVAPEEKKQVVAENTANASITERMMDEYGRENITKLNLDMARARYFVLKPEDIDNDEVIDLFEKKPTFKRDPQFKTAIKEIQKAPAKPKIVKQQDTPAKGGAGTISFDA